MKNLISLTGKKNWIQSLFTSLWKATFWHLKEKKPPKILAKEEDFWFTWEFMIHGLADPTPLTNDQIFLHKKEHVKE